MHDAKQNPAPDAAARLQRQDTVALKYLELARAELLERIKFGYQVLIVYAGGVGAIALWAYPSQTPPSVAQNGVAHPWSANARLVPIGVLVAFLAVVANWIIHHNEHMVNALARYQSGSLAEHLQRSLPDVSMWECSQELKADSTSHVLWDLGTQSALVVFPALVGSALQWPLRDQHNWVSWTWLGVAWFLTAIAILLSVLTVRGRRELRREAAAI